MQTLQQQKHQVKTPLRTTLQPLSFWETHNSPPQKWKIWRKIYSLWSRTLSNILHQFSNFQNKRYNAFVCSHFFVPFYCNNLYSEILHTVPFSFLFIPLTPLRHKHKKHQCHQKHSTARWTQLWLWKYSNSRLPLLKHQLWKGHFKQNILLQQKQQLKRKNPRVISFAMGSLAAKILQRSKRLQEHCFAGTTSLKMSLLKLYKLKKRNL